MTDDTSQTDQTEHVIELIRDAKLAMLTFLDPSGKLVSKPMATQDADFDGTLRFISQKDSEKVRAIEADPRVNVSYSARGSWASVSGTAKVVDDTEKLKELWNTFTDSWLDGGPEDPDNILLEVDAESAEYWGGPGNSTIISLVNVVKAKLTGETIDGDHGTVEL